LGTVAEKQRPSLLTRATDYAVRLAVNGRESNRSHRASVEAGEREEAACRASQARWEAMRELARGIIEADPRPWPTEHEWDFGIGPFWSARIGTTTYALVPRDDSYPRDVDRAVNAVRVVVIREEGGAR
jgi:hypothetical protein